MQVDVVPRCLGCVEHQRIVATVGRAPNRASGIPGRKFGVLRLCRLERADQKLPAAIDLIGDLKLSHGFVAGHRDKDDTLGRRGRFEAGFSPPPIVAAIKDMLVRRGLDQLVGAGAHRQALGKIKVGKGRNVLALPDVHRQDRIVVFMAKCQIVAHETRRRLGEGDDRGQRIGRIDRGDPFVIGGRAVDFRRRVAHGFQREFHVGRGEGRAVSPSHAVAQFDRGRLEVGRIAETLALPGDQRAGGEVRVKQRLVHGELQDVALFRDRGEVGVPVFDVGKLGRLVAPRGQNQSFVARNIRHVLRGCETGHRDQRKHGNPAAKRCR